MLDKKYIEQFAKKFGIKIQYYTEEKFIHEDAVKVGAVESLDFLSSNKQLLICFELDKNGNCVRYSDEGIDSFTRMKS